MRTGQSNVDLVKRVKTYGVNFSFCFGYATRRWCTARSLIHVTHVNQEGGWVTSTIIMGGG